MTSPQEDTNDWSEQQITATQGSTIQGVIQTIVSGSVKRDLYIGNNFYSRSVLEELRDFLVHAVTEYERRIHQTLARMPSVPSHPYKLLSAFTLKDESIFFGRSDTTDKLHEIVFRDRLTILHAQSGAGKTSLLQAGLSPRLIRQRYVPLYVCTYDDPVRAIKQAVVSPHERPEPKLLNDLTLQEFLGIMCGLLSRHQTLGLVVILDQFEQFYLSKEHLEDRLPFIQAIGDCYHDQALPVHFILAIRKDYYSDLADFEQMHPLHYVFFNHYLLYPMKREEAKAAITRPLTTGGPSVTYDQTFLEALLADLERSKMELPLLQLVCTRLYDIARDDHAELITQETYEAIGTVRGVLNTYLKEVLTSLPTREATDARRTLKALVSSDGHKFPLEEKELAKCVKTSRKILDDVLARLVHARLLLRHEINDKITYELVHDYLAAEIARWIDPTERKFKQAEELLNRELINWRIHHTLIPKSRLEVLYEHRGRFSAIEREAWKCLLCSALAEDFSVVDWTTAASDSGEILLVEILKESSAMIRQRSAEVLGKLQTAHAAEALCTALNDEDREIRQLATDALRRNRHPVAVKPLIIALKDEDNQVRQLAATALGAIGSPAALKPLIAALKDEDNQVRQLAATALGAIRNPATVEPLISALEDEDNQVRLWTVKALGRIGGSAALKPLIATLEDEDNQVRLWAVMALERIGEPAAIEPLVVALEDEDNQVRLQVVIALGRIGDPVAIEPLVAALEDEDNQVRLWAANVLVWIGGPIPVALKPLVAALEDEDNQVRLWAVIALGRIGDPVAVEPLVVTLEDEDNQVRLQAAKALGRIGDPAAVEPLISALEDEDNQVRLQAAKALGRIGDPAVVEPLVVALEDENNQVREHATEALKRIRWSSTVVKQFFLLKDRNSNVREYAAESLGRTGCSIAVEPLCAALKDKVKEVRQQAAGALERIQSPIAIKPLTKSLEDKDSKVRQQAAEALEKIQRSKPFSFSTQKETKDEQ